MDYFYDITLRFVPSADIPVVRVKQLDSLTRFIRIRVLQDYDPYIPGADETIVFREEKPDGHGILADSQEADAEIGRTLVSVSENGIITVEMTDQMTSCPGYSRCDICFVNGSQVISTAPFLIEVMMIPDIATEAVSSDDFRSLVNALNNVWKAGIISIPGATATGTIHIGTNWSQTEPYSISVTATDYTVTENTSVSIMQNDSTIERMRVDGVTGLYITNSNGSLTAYALGGRPTAAMDVPVCYLEADSSTYDNVQDGDVLMYSSSLGKWTNRSLTELGYLTETAARTLIASYDYQTQEQVNQLIADYIETLDASGVRY